MIGIPPGQKVSLICPVMQLRRPTLSSMRWDQGSNKYLRIWPTSPERTVQALAVRQAFHISGERLECLSKFHADLPSHPGETLGKCPIAVDPR